MIVDFKSCRNEPNTIFMLAEAVEVVVDTWDFSWTTDQTDNSILWLSTRRQSRLYFLRNLGPSV